MKREAARIRLVLSGIFFLLLILVEPDGLGDIVMYLTAIGMYVLSMLSLLYSIGGENE